MMTVGEERLGWGNKILTHGSSKRERGEEGVLRFDSGMVFRDEDVGLVVAGAAWAAKKLGGRMSKAEMSSDSMMTDLHAQE